MELLVVFGLPGAGKSFVGKILQKYFDFFVYEGDQDMPQNLKEAILKQELITDELRDMFFNKLIASAKNLTTQHDKVVITQTFIKEKYREQFLQAIPQTKFILVQSDTPIREKRLMERKEWEVDLAYWRKMSELFEIPEVPHTIIYNNEDGEETVKRQLQECFSTN